MQLEVKNEENNKSPDKDYDIEEDLENFLPKIENPDKTENSMGNKSQMNLNSPDRVRRSSIENLKLEMFTFKFICNLISILLLFTLSVSVMVYYSYTGNIHQIHKYFTPKTSHFQINFTIFIILWGLIIGIIIYYFSCMLYHIITLCVI
jgi:hypothetical protein